MKKFSKISRISKPAVHFFACVIEIMINEILTESIKAMEDRQYNELLLEHVIHAFHKQKSFLALLEWNKI
jgi:transcriptional regulator of met regulon